MTKLSRSAPRPVSGKLPVRLFALARPRAGRRALVSAAIGLYSFQAAQHRRLSVLSRRCCGTSVSRRSHDAHYSHCRLPRRLVRPCAGIHCAMICAPHGFKPVLCFCCSRALGGKRVRSLRSCVARRARCASYWGLCPTRGFCLGWCDGLHCSQWLDTCQEPLANLFDIMQPRMVESGGR